MPAPYVPDSEILSMEGAENDWGKALVALDGDTLDMLNGLETIYGILKVMQI